MESGDAGDARRLHVERRDDGKLVIDTSDDAVEAINDAIEGDPNHSELKYLTALREVLRHARAPGFSAEDGIDEHPPDPDPVDEEALAEEVEELEEELADELDDRQQSTRDFAGMQEDFYSRHPDFDEELPDLSDTIDKAALGAELRTIEQNLPASVRADLNDEELRELVCEILEERESFEAAMNIDTSEFYQDTDDEE